MCGFCGSLAGVSRSPADADNVNATVGEDTTFVPMVVEDISIVVVVDSGFVERTVPSGAANAVKAEMLVDATVEVGVMVSFEVGGTEWDETAAMVAGGPRVSSADVAMVAGEGVIVSDDGAEIAVETGGDADIAGILTPPPPPEDAVLT